MYGPKVDDWRDERQNYVKATHRFNRRYGLNYRPLPPIAFVDPDLWDQASIECLPPEHVTAENEPPKTSW